MTKTKHTHIVDVPSFQRWREALREAGVTLRGQAEASTPGCAFMVWRIVGARIGAPLTCVTTHDPRRPDHGFQLYWPSETNRIEDDVKLLADEAPE